jgi:hypothetical protein
MQQQPPQQFGYGPPPPSQYGYPQQQQQQHYGPPHGYPQQQHYQPQPQLQGRFAPPPPQPLYQQPPQQQQQQQQSPPAAAAPVSATSGGAAASAPAAAPAAPAVPFIGAYISLLSVLNVRYEGVLYTIDTKASTVALQNVRCFGTENRPAASFSPVDPHVYEVSTQAATRPARTTLERACSLTICVVVRSFFQFIIFAGKDIVDLSVLVQPQQQQIQPQPPQQPEPVQPQESSQQAQQQRGSRPPRQQNQPPQQQGARHTVRMIDDAPAAEVSHPNTLFCTSLPSSLFFLCVHDDPSQSILLAVSAFAYLQCFPKPSTATRVIRRRREVSV